MSQLSSGFVEPQDPTAWPDDAEVLERTARVIEALVRIPLVPSPQITCALSSALAHVSWAPCTVVVAIGSWQGQHAWSPVVVGRVEPGDPSGCTRAFAQKTVRQPLPPAGTTRTSRVPRSELGSALSGPPASAMHGKPLSSIHLTGFGTVVEATWHGLPGDAAPMAQGMLGCVMERAAKVIDGAFPNGVLMGSVLTPMELRVAGWLLSGETRRSMAAIAERSTHTVSDHIKHLYRKLDVSSQGELFKRLVHIDLESLRAGPARPGLVR
ncbi:MAG: helix-turn-helix transcriptional regulator [Phycisphaerales bacterium JB060]